MDEFAQADAFLDAGEGDKAMPIFRKLAEQGRLSAMHSMAHTYLYGLAGIERDYDKAFAWFTRGAGGGCPQCMYHLGMCNANGYGYGTPVDARLAAEWYRKSADRGDEDAMYEFAKRCEEGLGVSADLAEAKRWYREAASRGQEQAAERLKSL